MFSLGWTPRQCVWALLVDTCSVKFRREGSVPICMTEVLVEKRRFVDGYLEEVIILDYQIIGIRWLLHRSGTSWEDDVQEDGSLKTTRK